MRIDIPYGTTHLSIELPEDTMVLRSHHTPALPDERGAVLASLREPLGSASLRECVKHLGPEDRIAIVISDITRPTPNERLIPWLLEELAHIPRSRFVILNGTGSHRANTREELISMLGRGIVDTVEIVNHNAFDENTLTYLGDISSGAPVWVNRRYMEAAFRIATGFIEPHFFAGFSGGAKGVIPGVAGIQTIQALHNARLIGDPRATWAVLEGNPVQQGIQDAVAMCPPEFMLNVTLDEERRITGVYSGHYVEAHYKGCEKIAQTTTQEVNAPFDIVITSNNGYPLDQNLYQTVKGMTAAVQIVRKGGAIVTVAECRDGLPDHGNYKELLQMRERPQGLLDLINSPGFTMHDQWQVQKQAIVQLQANVYLHSSLSDDVVRMAKLLPAPDLQRTIDELLHRYGPTARVAVLPEGPLTVPYVADYSHAV